MNKSFIDDVWDIPGQILLDEEEDEEDDDGDDDEVKSAATSRRCADDYSPRSRRTYGGIEGTSLGAMTRAV